MLNKINQRIDEHRSRLAFSRNLQGKSKLTVFMVYKMIERRAEKDEPVQCSSFSYQQSTPQNSVTPKPIAQIYSGLRKTNTRTEQSQSKIDCFQDYRIRSRCQSHIAFNGDRNNKNLQNIQTHKTIQDKQSLDFKKVIIQKMKSAAKNKEKVQQKINKYKDPADFGLNIRQIKKIDIMNRKYSKKQNLLFVKDEQTCLKSKSQLKTQSIAEEDQFNASNNKFMRRTNDFLSISKDAPFSQQQESFLKKYKQCPATSKYREVEQFHPHQRSQVKSGNKKDSSYYQKMKKMFGCLDIILNSFHCQMAGNQRLRSSMKSEIKVSEQINVDIAKKSSKKIKNIKYYYYIGNGNNANLIRSIFRKRSWWAEADNIGKANFVWTQLKLPSILQKMKKFDDSNWETDVVYYEEKNNEMNQDNTMNDSGKKSNSTTNSQHVGLKQNYLLQLFHQKQDRRYHFMLQQRQAKLRLDKIVVPELIHNHYEHNYMFGNKNALEYNISQYYLFMGKDVSTILPLTYYIEKANKKSFNQFQKIFNQGKIKKSVWIVKPAENSNRGQGIQVTTSLNEIKSKLNSHQKIIVQSYIKNLLLYNGRKFDIRTYMLALTIHGRLKFYWYDEGYIRTSSQMYDISNLNDKFIHLTNDAIQKYGDNYGLYEEGNKLSYSEFQRYLQNRFSKDNIHVSYLHEQMREITKEAVKAIYCRLDPNKKQFGFELFGLDFIIDAQYKPYLIEINTNPCLQLSSGCLERLIPRMIQNLFRISVDPIIRPEVSGIYSKTESYYIYDETFLERNRFTLIFDQKYDRNFEWQQRCRKMSGLQWGQGEQQEYEDEGSLIVVDY